MAAVLGVSQSSTCFQLCGVAEDPFVDLVDVVACCKCGVFSLSLLQPYVFDCGL